MAEKIFLEKLMDIRIIMQETSSSCSVDLSDIEKTLIKQQCVN